MVDTKNPAGDNPEFDDDFADMDAFEDSDFDSSEFEEGNLGAEGEFAEEDGYEEDSWEDEKTTKKSRQPSYTTGGTKKSFLSFNAIVMIGAFVVGLGVLYFTVRGKAEEKAAGKQDIFRSVLNIGGIMDGTLFGPKEEETAEQVPVTGSDEKGFLDDPDSVGNQPVISSGTGQPPMPTPLTPSEEGNIQAADPLTPLPYEIQQGAEPTPGASQDQNTAGQSPRSPEEGGAFIAQQLVIESQQGDAVIPAVPSDSSQKPLPKAEDLLKAALANREKGQMATPEAIPPQEQDTAILPSVPVQDMAPVVSEPVQAKTAPAPLTPALPPESAPQVSVALEQKIDAVLKRMDTLEKEISTIKQSGSSDYQQLEQDVETLKGSLASIRKSSSSVTPPEDGEIEVSVVKAPVKKTAPRKIQAPKPVSTASASGAGWELRAAQPGRAWVSRPGHREMQGVEVGQTLAGVGRVTAITYQNGRWAVVGTQGQILQ